MHGVLVVRVCPPTVITRFIKTILCAHPGQTFRLVFDKAFYRELNLLFTLPNNEGAHKVNETYFTMIGNIGYQDLSQSLLHFMNDIFYVNPHMPELLKKLKESGCTLHLFSNIGATSLQMMIDSNKFSEIFMYFEKNSINSLPINIYPDFKPKGQTYQLALNNAGCTPDQAIMIDDTLDRLPTKTGIARAKRKALKKGISYVAPKPWAAGILYNHRNHKALLTYCKQLGLIDS